MARPLPPNSARRPKSAPRTVRRPIAKKPVVTWTRNRIETLRLRTMVEVCERLVHMARLNGWLRQQQEEVRLPEAVRLAVVSLYRPDFEPWSAWVDPGLAADWITHRLARAAGQDIGRVGDVPVLMANWQITPAALHELAMRCHRLWQCELTDPDSVPPHLRAG